jgi:hypothetical protein
MVIQTSQSRGLLRVAFYRDFPRETLTPHSADGEATRRSGLAKLLRGVDAAQMVILGFAAGKFPAAGARK